MEKKCEECRWFTLIYDSAGVGFCGHGNAGRWFASNERINGNCGPSGRYWEPREEEE